MTTTTNTHSAPAQCAALCLRRVCLVGAHSSHLFFLQQFVDSGRGKEKEKYIFLHVQPPVGHSEVTVPFHLVAIYSLWRDAVKVPPAKDSTPNNICVTLWNLTCFCQPHAGKRHYSEMCTTLSHAALVPIKSSTLVSSFFHTLMSGCECYQNPYYYFFFASAPVCSCFKEVSLPDASPMVAWWQVNESSSFCTATLL